MGVLIGVFAALMIASGVYSQCPPCLTGYPFCATPLTGPPCPCYNSGVCSCSTTGIVPVFTCTCPNTHTGPNCLDPSNGNACHSYPCQNGGVCTPVWKAGLWTYTCTCPPAFPGPNCEGVTTNLCLPNPCYNAAVCMMLGGVRVCICPSGFTGPLCEIPPPTMCTPNPCQHGGFCTPIGTTSFHCTCVSGYTGFLCQTAPNPCVPNPCMNGGACQSYIGIIFCTCLSGYIGDRCQTAECLAKADIVLVLDASGSIGITDFNLLKGFAKQLVDRLGTVSLSHNRIAIVVFSDIVHNILYLSGSVSAAAVKAQIDAVQYYSGMTALAGALRNVRLTVLTAVYGARTDAPDIVIVFTDGIATDADPVPEAGLLKNLMVTVVVVGIGQSAGSSENQAIASPGMYISVATFSALPGQLLAITSAACVTNPCDIHPCMNGGICTQTAVGGYTCTCISPPFFGVHCEHVYNPCLPNPCLHAGVCLPGTAGSPFTCQCMPPYYGTSCELIMNPCLPNPCQHNGFCFPGTGGSPFTCLCMTPWQGITCEVMKNPCLPNACQNGGVCIPNANYIGYTCQCVLPYYGTHCELHHDCLTYPCQNGGSCVNSPFGIRVCECTCWTTGTFCEHPPTQVPLHSPCQSGPCFPPLKCHCIAKGWVCRP